MAIMIWSEVIVEDLVFHLVTTLIWKRSVFQFDEEWLLWIGCILLWIFLGLRVSLANALAEGMDFHNLIKTLAPPRRAIFLHFMISVHRGCITWWCCHGAFYASIWKEYFLLGWVWNSFFERDGVHKKAMTNLLIGLMFAMKRRN